MQENKLLEMAGSVEQVIFRNEKNGYAIIEINNGEELVTAVGTMPWVSAGEELRVVGNWINNPNYGTQFKVEAFEHSKPVTASAILKYLSSGAIKGIGPGTAAQIVAATKVDYRPIGTGVMGPITTKMRALFDDVVRAKIPKYHKWNVEVG